jgi:CO/xanthine dehydrogenase Mo-binding subunit
MNAPVTSPTRRMFLATGGAVVVTFALRPLSSLAQGTPQAKPKLPGSLDKAPYLDAWIGIGGDGAVTVFTGKAELGQGIKTALIQWATE